MSRWLDQTKFGLHQQLSKLYKDAKAKAPPEEFKEFEAWFWKIRPLLNVDLSSYVPASPGETSGPNPPASQSINSVEN